MKANSKHFDAIISLPGIKRFAHFIKVIADREEVWGLYKDGWALAETDEGVSVFPLWPAKEYAQLCAANEWATYEPRAISLDDFMKIILPKIKMDSVLLGVFSTPAGKGVTPPVDELTMALESELQNY